MIRATIVTALLIIGCCLGEGGLPSVNFAAADDQAKVNQAAPSANEFENLTAEELRVLGNEILRNQQNPEPEVNKEASTQAAKSPKSSSKKASSPPAASNPMAQLISATVERVAAAATPAPSVESSAKPDLPASPSDQSQSLSPTTAAVDTTPLTVDVEVPESIDVGHMVTLKIRESGQSVRERYVTITPEPREEDTIIENGGLIRRFCGDPGIYKVRIVSIGETRGFAECQKTITIKNPYIAAAVAADREQREAKLRDTASKLAPVDKDNPASAVRELLRAVDSPNKSVEAAQIADQFRRRATLSEAIAESRVALQTIGGDIEAWDSFLKGATSLFDELRKSGAMISDGMGTAAEKETNALRRVAEELEKEQ